ncbi:MAG: hypothetical protein Q9169_004745 [Polycauliona sp. 2 TL-2023]
MSFSSIHLVLDFDGTLTTTSTLPLIYNVGHRLNPSCLPWQAISQAYIDDHDALKSALVTKPTSLTQELEWLESLRSIEHRSIARVEATKVFRNITTAIVRAAAEEEVRDRRLAMRVGWERLVAMTIRGEGKVGIVSVGWSADFIRGCLRASLGITRAAERNETLEEGRKGADVALIDDVRANDILGGEEGKMDRYWDAATRDDRSRILTAQDKLRVMMDMVGTDQIDEPRRPVVYVGDSTTDLECLLHADIGIFVGGSADSMTEEQMELNETLNRISLDRRWIGEMREGDMKVPPVRSINTLLWWANDFDEICNSPLLSTGDVLDGIEK